jgi:hypothetical protein
MYIRWRLSASVDIQTCSKSNMHSDGTCYNCPAITLTILRLSFIPRILISLTEVSHNITLGSAYTYPSLRSNVSRRSHPWSTCHLLDAPRPITPAQSPSFLLPFLTSHHNLQYVGASPRIKCSSRTSGARVTSIDLARNTLHEHVREFELETTEREQAPQLPR